MDDRSDQQQQTANDQPPSSAPDSSATGGSDAAPGGDDPATLLGQVSERRLTTLALADQIRDAERWHAPALPGGQSLHAVLSCQLGWDEWIVAAYELSALRPLPPILAQAIDDEPALGARATKRYAAISRDDVLSSLQAAASRIVSAARGRGGAAWFARPIEGIAPATDGTVRTAGVLLTRHIERERLYAEAISLAFNIQPDLDRFRNSTVAESDSDLATTGADSNDPGDDGQR